MKLLYPLTVFYDASCPLCAGEMCALRDRGNDKLLLVDCSAPDFDETVLAGTPIRRADLMNLMHARDARGRWLVGVDAFAAIYAAAGLDGLARVWPRMRRVYPWIARNRQRLSRFGLPKLVRVLLSTASGGAGHR